MEPALVRSLRAMNKVQLILLLEKLSERYVTLPTDISALLNTTATNVQADSVVSFNVDDLVLHRATMQDIALQDLSIYRERIASYDERLQQGMSQQAILDELVRFLQGADELLSQDHYLPALEIYELILDARLSQPDGVLTAIFDRAIDEFLPELDLLLAEVSSLMIIDPVQFNAADSSQIQPILTPQLSTTTRQRWLARMFSLWLKRMDMDDHHLDEQILEMIHETMWHEDIPVIRQLILDAIASSPSDDHANIVDFSHQARIRHLEKLLREFPL